MYEFFSEKWDGFLKNLQLGTCIFKNNIIQTYQRLKSHELERPDKRYGYFLSSENQI